MQYNSQTGDYRATLNDGSILIVDADEMAECRQDIENGEYDNESHRQGELAELDNPETWIACAGLNDNVRIEQK